MGAQAALKKKKVTLITGNTVSVAKKNYSSKTLRNYGAISDRDHEMDNRAEIAVSTAIKKAKVKGNPIARFDRSTGTAYLEYPDGRRETIE